MGDGNTAWISCAGRLQRSSNGRTAPLRSNNLSALLAAARAGLGLAALPRYVAHESIGNGAVRPLLERWSLPAQEIHAVFPSPKFVPSKVRSFCDFLSTRFGADWWTATRAI